jgi:hypothetical protein
MNNQSKRFRIDTRKALSFSTNVKFVGENLMADSDKKDNKGGDKKSGSTDKKKKSSTKK